MRVIFNALSSYRQRSGVGSYVAALAGELKSLAGSDFATFPDRWLAPLAAVAGRVVANKPSARSSHLSSPVAPSALSRLRNRFRRITRSTIQDLCERSFRRACRRGEFDLYHEPNFIPWDCDAPTVATVHDLSVILHPDWHPRERVEFHDEHFERSLSRCRHIVTVSQCMRREIISTMSIDPFKVTAIPNGVRTDMRPLGMHEVLPTLRRLGLSPGYLLYVGTIEPRKNILTLLKSYCALEESVRSRHPLVLAGSWGWNFTKERTYFEAEARHRGAVHLGYVADRDLPALYNGADALVYPSHYEGFGLPPIEMMACGGAVLASTAGALREVCGRRAWYVDAMDCQGWRSAMSRVLTDRDWRQELRRGTLEHAKSFSWRRSAQQTWEAYQQIVGAKVLPALAAA